MMIFNLRLRSLRTEANISQQELAQATGTSKSSINMYERGDRRPPLELLEAFADFFNVDMNYLLGYQSQKHLEDGAKAVEEASDIQEKPCDNIIDITTAASVNSAVPSEQAAPVETDTTEADDASSSEELFFSDHEIELIHAYRDSGSASRIVDVLLCNAEEPASSEDAPAAEDAVASQTDTSEQVADELYSFREKPFNAFGAVEKKKRQSVFSEDLPQQSELALSVEAGTLPPLDILSPSEPELTAFCLSNGDAKQLLLISAPASSEAVESSVSEALRQFSDHDQTLAPLRLSLRRPESAVLSVPPEADVEASFETARPSLTDITKPQAFVPSDRQNRSSTPDKSSVFAPNDPMILKLADDTSPSAILRESTPDFDD